MCFSGCGSSMHGYTEEKALNRYVLIDEKGKNFGYKRLRYITAFFELEPFLVINGKPDFLYEEEIRGRKRFSLFYVESNSVIVMSGKNFGGGLIFEERQLTAYEKATYEELKKHL